MVTKWVLFYDTGEVVTSSKCEWKHAPVTGAVIAVWWDEHSVRHLESGDDSLVYTEDAIIGVNIPTDAIEGAARQEARAGILKYGVYMEPQAWTDVREKADNLREFPE